MAARDNLTNVEPGLFTLTGSYDNFMNFVAEARTEQATKRTIDVYVVTPFIDKDRLTDLFNLSQDNGSNLEKKIKLYTRANEYVKLGPELQEQCRDVMEVHLVPANHSPDFHCKWAAMRDGKSAVVLHTSANVHSNNMHNVADFHQREFFETIPMTADVFEQRFFNPIQRCCQEGNEADALVVGMGNLAVAEESFGLYDETECFTQFRDFVQEGCLKEGTKQCTVYIAMAPFIDPDTARAVLPAGGAGKAKKIFYIKKTMANGVDIQNLLNDAGWGIEPRPCFHCKWAAFSYLNGKGIEVVDILLTSAVMTKYHMSAERGARSFINSLHRISGMLFDDTFTIKFLNMMD